MVQVLQRLVPLLVEGALEKQPIQGKSPRLEVSSFFLFGLFG
jgi:hypothetical protein